MKHRFIGSGVMRPTEEIHLSREYIARDPRTGLPIAVAKQRKSKKRVKAETGPWVALSDKDVLALARGEMQAGDTPAKRRALWRDASWRDVRAEETRAPAGETRTVRLYSSVQL